MFEGTSVSPLSRFPANLLVLLLTVLSSACTAKPPVGDADALAEFREANDPYEPTNRFFYKVNDSLDTYLLRPVAVAYRDLVPAVVRRPIHNVLNNLGNPAQFANDVLEGKPRRAGDTMMRFVINSTAGVGGVFDLASDLGYPDHTAEFGLTLAVWGVGEGPFLFLPVLGPTNPRDAVGFGANTIFDPLTWATFGGQHALGYSRLVVGAVDTRERLLDQIDSIKRGALDPYATFRSLYRQNRADQIIKSRTDWSATVPAWFPQR